MEEFLAAVWDYIKTYIATGPNISIMLAMGTLIEAVRMMLPKVWEHRFATRGILLTSIALCSIAVWVPGARPDEAIAQRIFVGISLGGFTMIVHRQIHKYLMKRRKANGDK